MTCMLGMGDVVWLWTLSMLGVMMVETFWIGDLTSMEHECFVYALLY